MHYWKGLESVPPDFGPSVVTIGNFDGVHRGHREVLSTLTRLAGERSAAAVAISFDPHPAKVHRPDSYLPLIMGLADRVDSLAETGLDAVLMVNYTLAFSQATAEEFVQDVIVDRLHACAVVVGHDVRFGRGNAGDFDTMVELGRIHGFDVIGIDDVGETRRWSSTWIREALTDGDVATANEILGRAHRMRGEIVHGAARGRELGFPTANLSTDASGIIPADGVYAGWLVDEAGMRWPAAISVGSNPTFEGVSRQVEAHVIDRPDEEVGDFDLYGQQSVVEFVARLRPMVAYHGIEALIEQMNEDVELARGVLEHDRAGA
ncbi:MAG: bifunctional riboflavin kinase/FAD synthetase [Micrococcaceae bacterium]|uniref:bifunctional riboflavin kinase/FAD synthetase n=1 Tax=Arthrobacter sp. AOP36-C1-22 TaxID=3457683 RepID=UPI00265173FA|nr:bifunctional riboflavin kinase/FAD synthetase [Micrococcaceae bacterium]MDN5905681.1 bifunctional riboflavin kinase/FAD synthetase [Micrococcaceae bacterium]MDN6169818.1 bifunctional riboflavin kinase/FAD synthetase [Micrococcaceae bacterium]MDN6201325.1 bifunctional riboflavin kinase/FAD synthetase [Micrococcaceae bacterium]MDN6300228.1 bifunctional riboflavin kinase/FAD synthetase [Micrococcaceae bacterium]